MAHSVLFVGAKDPFDAAGMLAKHFLAVIGTNRVTSGRSRAMSAGAKELRKISKPSRSCVANCARFSYYLAPQKSRRVCRIVSLNPVAAKADLT
jgi:hypothetical protein